MITAGFQKEKKEKRKADRHTDIQTDRHKRYEVGGEKIRDRNGK